MSDDEGDDSGDRDDRDDIGMIVIVVRYSVGMNKVIINVVSIEWRFRCRWRCCGCTWVPRSPLRWCLYAS